jgi:hypothetical protein
MFGDREAWLGQIEHLSLLDAYDHRSRQPGEAMATGFRFATLDDIGICRRPQRAAGMSGLAAARLARLAAQAARDARRLLQPIARRRLAAVRTVGVHSTPKVRHFLAQRRVLRPQYLNLALKRGNQILNLGSQNHPYLDSHFPHPRPQQSRPTTHFPKRPCQSDSPTLGVTAIFQFPRK